MAKIRTKLDLPWYHCFGVNHYWSGLRQTHSLVRSDKHRSHHAQTGMQRGAGPPVGTKLQLILGISWWKLTVETQRTPREHVAVPIWIPPSRLPFRKLGIFGRNFRKSRQLPMNTVRNDPKLNGHCTRATHYSAGILEQNSQSQAAARAIFKSLFDKIRLKFWRVNGSTSGFKVL